MTTFRVFYLFAILYAFCNDARAAKKYTYIFYIHPADTTLGKQHLYPARDIDTGIYDVVFILPKESEKDRARLSTLYGIDKEAFKILFDNSPDKSAANSKQSSFTITKDKEVLKAGSISQNFTKGIVHFFNCLDSGIYRAVYKYDYISHLDRKLMAKGHYIYSLNDIIGVRRIDIANRNVKTYKVQDSIVLKAYDILFDSVKKDETLQLIRREWLKTAPIGAKIYNYCIENEVIHLYATIPMASRVNNMGVYYEYPVIFQYTLEGEYLNTFLLNRTSTQTIDDSEKSYFTIHSSEFFVAGDTAYISVTSKAGNNKNYYLARFYLNPNTKKCEYLALIERELPSVYAKLDHSEIRLHYCGAAKKYMLSIDSAIYPLDNKKVSYFNIARYDNPLESPAQIKESVAAFNISNNRVYFITKTRKGNYYYTCFDFQSGRRLTDKILLNDVEKNQRVYATILDSYNTDYILQVVDGKTIVRKKVTGN